MTGSNPTDRGKLGTKRHILTDKNGIPLSAVIAPASTHDIKAATELIDNTVIGQPVLCSASIEKRRKRGSCLQHLCFDRAYSSISVKHEIIKRGYLPHMPHKEKEGREENEKRNTTSEKTLQGDGLWREQTHGTTGSGSCSQDTKRRQGTILVGSVCHAVS